MKRKDLLTPIGIGLGATMILLGIYFNSGFGGVSSFIQVSSIVVVIGGLVGALLINFSVVEMKMFGKVMKEAFHSQNYNLRELINYLFNFQKRLEEKVCLPWKVRWMM